MTREPDMYSVLGLNTYAITFEPNGKISKHRIKRIPQKLLSQISQYSISKGAVKKY